MRMIIASEWGLHHNHNAPPPFSSPYRQSPSTLLPISSPLSPLLFSPSRLYLIVLPHLIYFTFPLHPFPFPPCFSYSINTFRQFLFNPSVLSPSLLFFIQFRLFSLYNLVVSCQLPHQLSSVHSFY